MCGLFLAYLRPPLLVGSKIVGLWSQRVLENLSGVCFFSMESHWSCQSCETYIFYRGIYQSEAKVVWAIRCCWRAFLAASSARMFPGIFTWLGTQTKIMSTFSVSSEWRSSKNYTNSGWSKRWDWIASKDDKELEMIKKFFYH